MAFARTPRAVRRRKKYRKRSSSRRGRAGRASGPRRGRDEWEGDEPRPRRGRDVDRPRRRVAATATTRIVRGDESPARPRRRGSIRGAKARRQLRRGFIRGDESRRRRGYDVDSPRRRVANAACGYSAETSRRRGRDADPSEETSRSDTAAAMRIHQRSQGAAAATRIYQRSQIAATPLRRGSVRGAEARQRRAAR